MGLGIVFLGAAGPLYARGLAEKESCSLNHPQDQRCANMICLFPTVHLIIGLSLLAISPNQFFKLSVG